MSNKNMTMRKVALAAMPSGPVPCAATRFPRAAHGKRVEIYDPREGKTRRLDPYGAAAKQVYRFYIRELDFDETWIALCCLVDFEWPRTPAIN